MTLMGTTAAWLVPAGKTCAGQAVTYRRSNGEEATLDVTRGRTDREEQPERGVIGVVQTDDVLVSVADFEAAFGSGIRPEDDDEIVVDGRLFKVRPLGSEHSWRYRDPNRLTLRIHVKDFGPDE